MNRVVIVARTRMHGGHVCIGGHDLDNEFRSVRLLDWFGDHWPHDSLFAVGDMWNVRYQRKESARPPHVEDVIVSEHQHAGRVPDLKALVLGHVRPWSGGTEVLFEGTVRGTEVGSPYIPPKGRLPRRSTWYWLPSEDLERIPGEVRFAWAGPGSIKRFKWVGEQTPPERIASGSLMRVALSRLFKAERVPEGYYVQISGVL